MVLFSMIMLTMLGTHESIWFNENDSGLIVENGTVGVTIHVGLNGQKQCKHDWNQ